ncbi:F-box only protein 43 [Thalassophryne amazonica]|uniref:F-box only protein 43 n=1 Tax=Thalassophryne amazonica TaxID=390379 RepID=UPI0014720D74|nr:F-box only protein 43 [Thalassophryne amazonica]
MQCTPDHSVYVKSCKDQRCHGSLSDSGYSSVLRSPWKDTRVTHDTCRSLSSAEFSESPKENFQLSVSPKKGRSKDSALHLDTDSKRVSQAAAACRCETPQGYKKDTILRRRLLMSKPATDETAVSNRSPWTNRTKSSLSDTSETWFSASFDSLDSVLSGPMLTNTLKLEPDLSLSGRIGRLFFSNVRTSTLEDGKQSISESSISLLDADMNESITVADQLTVGASKDRSQSPLRDVTNSPYEISSIESTPSTTRIPKCIRSVCEDSGFSSLTLDKSRDSSEDHDGSFQELLPSVSKGNNGTPYLPEVKRRSRFQRQHRLSTLKEGGSQSEEDSADRKHGHLHQRCSHSNEDGVFVDDTTPSSIVLVQRSNSLASAVPDYATPHREAVAKLEATTPLCTAPASTDATLLCTASVNLSLTPALQLVHAMSQKKAQMFVAQSPCLQEQLRSAAALAGTPVTFRTTMPLSGLIGRKMGLKKVDILTELKKRNLGHVLAVILGHLPSECIYRFGQVCQNWNEIIKQDKRARFRRTAYLHEVEAALELGSAVHIPDAETRLTLSKRSALKLVQAQSRTSGFCTPQSGKKSLSSLQDNTSHSGSSSKREKFLEIAKTLFSDECLKPCPRCQHPARCHLVKREGVCSRSDCAFRFCTSCFCAFHGSKDCGSQSAGHRKKDTRLPGSAESKRNVRRL